MPSRRPSPQCSPRPSLQPDPPGLRFHQQRERYGDMTRLTRLTPHQAMLTLVAAREVYDAALAAAHSAGGAGGTVSIGDRLSLYKRVGARQRALRVASTAAVRAYRRAGQPQAALLLEQICPDGLVGDTAGVGDV